jgi:hypothetical protein
VATRTTIKIGYMKARFGEATIFVEKGWRNHLIKGEGTFFGSNYFFTTILDVLGNVENWCVCGFWCENLASKCVCMHLSFRVVVLTRDKVRKLGTSRVLLLGGFLFMGRGFLQ